MRIVTVAAQPARICCMGLRQRPGKVVSLSAIRSSRHFEGANITASSSEQFRLTRIQTGQSKCLFPPFSRLRRCRRSGRRRGIAPKTWGRRTRNCVAFVAQDRSPGRAWAGGASFVRSPLCRRLLERAPGVAAGQNLTCLLWPAQNDPRFHQTRALTRAALQQEKKQPHPSAGREVRRRE